MFLFRLNNIASVFIIILSTLSSSWVNAFTNTADAFKQIVGQEFVADAQNTVHEWVYDFLLAVEEGDEELLDERIKELDLVDAGNRAVLLKAGDKLAKELNRYPHRHMLQRQLNRISAIVESFSLEAAEDCELTRKRKAERTQRDSSWSERLMSRTGARIAFVLAALPLASAATIAMNVSNATFGKISSGVNDVATPAPSILEPFVPLLAPPPQRDFKKEFMALLDGVGGQLTMYGLAMLISSEQKVEELKELLPHLFANKIVDPQDLWNEWTGGDLPELSGYKLILEAGGGLPKDLQKSLYSLMLAEQYDKAELLLDYGADVLPLLKNLRSLKVSKIPPELVHKILSGVQTIHEGLHHNLEECLLYKYHASSTPSKDPDAERIADVWISMINKGLPFDLSRFLNSVADINYQRIFIKRVLAETNIQMNQVEYNKRTLFENVLEIGNFKILAAAKAKGGYTKRPVVALLTDDVRNGRMYLAAAQTLRDRGVVVVTLWIESDSLNKVEGEIKRLYRGKPQEVVKCNLPEVVRIVEIAENAVKTVDAIWISGGSNVGESWYTDQGSYAPSLARDVLEIAVLHFQSLQPYKPLIGVCRGHQMINVFYGGTLQDLGERDPGNPLVVEKSSGLLGRSFPSEAKGWSYHYQSVDKVADMFEPVVKSNGMQRGMVKGIQHKTRELPIFGIQFHPEYVSDPDPTREHILQRFLSMTVASKYNTCLEPEFELTCEYGRKLFQDFDGK